MVILLRERYRSNLLTKHQSMMDLISRIAGKEIDVGYKKEEVLRRIQKQSMRYFAIHFAIYAVISAVLFIKKKAKDMRMNRIINHLRERVQEEIDKAQNK